jgi:hypothetical protein
MTGKDRIRDPNLRAEGGDSAGRGSDETARKPAQQQGDAGTGRQGRQPGSDRANDPQREQSGERPQQPGATQGDPGGWAQQEDDEDGLAEG